MGDTAPPAGLVGHEAVIEGHPPLTDAGRSGEDLAGIFYRRGRSRLSRAAGVTGFQLLPRRWVVEPTLPWLNRNRRLAKSFETSIARATAWMYIASTQLLDRRLGYP
jgi:transposase